MSDRAAEPSKHIRPLLARDVFPPPHARLWLKQLFPRTTSSLGASVPLTASVSPVLCATVPFHPGQHAIRGVYKRRHMRLEACALEPTAAKSVLGSSHSLAAAYAQGCDFEPLRVICVRHTSAQPL